MSITLIALALFGCSDDAVMCQRLTAQARTFESPEQCELALEAAFETDLVRQAQYPTVIARCIEKSQWVRIGENTVDLSAPEIRLANDETKPMAPPRDRFIEVMSAPRVTVRALMRRWWSQPAESPHLIGDAGCTAPYAGWRGTEELITPRTQYGFYG